MNFGPLRIEAHGNRLDDYVASAWNCNASRRDVDFIGVDSRWMQRIAEEAWRSYREKY